MTSIGGNRRGFRRLAWLLVVLAAIPVAALVSGNLWLATPHGRGWIAGKIQHRSGLETRVGNASWWPWKGVTVESIELLQPPALRQSVKEPLVRIESLDLPPVWKALIHGRLEFQSVELRSPRVVLPVELLSYLARSAVPAIPADAAPVPADTQPPVSVTEIPPAAAAPPVAVAPVETPEIPRDFPVSPPRPTGWIRLKNASFSLVSAGSGQALLDLHGITGALPLVGDPARSSLRLGTVSSMGNHLVGNLEAVFEWQSPLLSLRPLEIEIAGIKAIVAGKIARLGGLPLQLEAKLPEHRSAAFPLPGNGNARAASISADARFRGLLLAPPTWQGDFVARASSVSVHFADRDASFDRGMAVAVLRGGVLSCIDARLLGDDLSLLGNATLLADGRAAGVLRFVAPPENLVSLVRQRFPGIESTPALTPLATPQRAAFDLHAFGSPGRFFLVLGNGGPVIALQSPATPTP